MFCWKNRNKFRKNGVFWFVFNASSKSCSQNKWPAILGEVNVVPLLSTKWHLQANQIYYLFIALIGNYSFDFLLIKLTNIILITLYGKNILGLKKEFGRYSFKRSLSLSHPTKLVIKRNSLTNPSICFRLLLVSFYTQQRTVAVGAASHSKTQPLFS